MCREIEKNSLARRMREGVAWVAEVMTFYPKKHPPDGLQLLKMFDFNLLNQQLIELKMYVWMRERNAITVDQVRDLLLTHSTLDAS